MPNEPKTSRPDPEQFCTFKNAAEALRIPYFKVQRAARQGLLPTYKMLNGRRDVRLSDIVARMTPTAD